MARKSTRKKKATDLLQYNHLMVAQKQKAWRSKKIRKEKKKKSDQKLWEKKKRSAKNKNKNKKK